jgi:hypothetical protein
MTEISIVFLSKPEDTLEQMTATVGFAQDHIEVSYIITSILYLSYTVGQYFSTCGRRPTDGGMAVGRGEHGVAIIKPSINV